MTIFGAAFCNHQVVYSIDFVKMRTFRITSPRTSPDVPYRGKLLPGLYVYFKLVYPFGAVSGLFPV
ncbi:MAG: hypothetical protein U0T82_09760 [Bacteroidales bacterium]